MKLKRMWPGLCILIVFMIFDVIMVASSSFFSGLFPYSDTKLTYSIALTVLGVLIMSVLTFLLGRICDHIELESLAHSIGVRVIYALMLIAVFIGGIFYRLYILGQTTAEPTGKLSLFENAQVGAKAAGAEYDLLSIVYTDILRFIMYFTGNKITTAYGLQIAFFMIFVILGTITCKVLLGKAGSVIFASYVSFMPIFTENLQKAVIGTDELFLTMLGVELFVIGIYLRNASDGKYNSRWYVIWYVFVGVIVGFMTYLDAGTFITVLPLLLSVMFMAGDKGYKGVFSFLFVSLSGVITFFAMITQEAGFAHMGAVLGNWSDYYFRNLNTFSMFWTYTNYKLLYLITFIVMSGVLVGYFRNKNFGRISPWLLATILVFVATPFFGATRMNDQNVVTVFFAFVLACVVSLITLTRQEQIFDEDIEEDDEDDSVDEELRTIIGDEDAEYVPLEKKALQGPRYVPEGMVLPTGSEDEMDVDASKMKMPKFEGKIGLDRKSSEHKITVKPEIKTEPEHKERKVVFRKRTEYKTAHVEKENKKDDFDLPFKNGDDFDL
ncbi:hypothetical protein bpr_I1214 [Butyrivibrio proteoclasticus B316]|uniref:Uncharacterized protein n=1 Tax=Butyrivibrio proteoclasticus (strain ATCC 51982 / DSM 14932 / B316) TaxID=515622 RepID=E0S2C8_BUTPB|nr:hypothetical protein [Butyrivibrio proteoclasticus]ADL33953.1 hypothetical protein bpr_I1214 [Butyrivibrio proteoclasticus B316]